MSNTAASALAVPAPTHSAVIDERPAAVPDGIGDIVDAGRRSAYPHLAPPRTAPTPGRLAAAAAAAAAALARPSLWPRRRGHWQPAPRPARRHATGRMKVSTLALEPNGFAALPAPAGGAPGPGSVLRLVAGSAHLVSTSPDGRMRALREVPAGRTLALGSGGGRWLVNTGPEAAVVVRVSG
ncbi:hypothetical protein O4J56_03765 [Nocardiopsis sp. RSe5-2]|uniref:Uncharacterized protein n=1 Tax=Nocardiopsis endophytica TaxID=3018445 RepID=A0ABT4TYH3_9ACTN|nr:hypothetical protein [Nocardiopsis endophytica]MDA2809747.1 hypothetical protein [Nocardiopsis endophytica]